MNTGVRNTLQAQQQFAGLLHLLMRVAARAPHRLLAIVVAIAAFFAVAPRLSAGPVTTPNFVTPGEMRSGSLLLKTEGERYVEAPLVGTGVDLFVSGPTDRPR